MNKFPDNWREGLDLPGAMVCAVRAEEAREEAHEEWDSEADAWMRDYVRKAFRGQEVPEEYADWA